MRKTLLMMLTTALILCSCKKEDEIVAIDMTAKSYKAETKFRSYPVYLYLNFSSDGTAKLYVFGQDENKVTLKYSIADKNATETTVHIFGELDKTLLADGLSSGTKIDWKADISRLKYNAHIVGFKTGDYHFTSY